MPKITGDKLKTMVIELSKVKEAPSVSKKEILMKVSSEDIFRHYLGDRFVVNKAITSPLRNDKNPSFCLFYAGNGTCLYKDFNDDSGDGVKFIQKLFGVSYSDAINIIYKDFNVQKLATVNDYLTRINQIGKLEPNINVTTKILASIQPFNSVDVRFWKDFGISQSTLELFEVFPLKKVYIAGYGRPLAYEFRNPIYGYRFDAEKGSDPAFRWQVYRPSELERKNRFRMNTISTDLFGYKQLPLVGQIVVIAKSAKDVMCLHELGINAIACRSEGIEVPEEVINDLEDRFDYVIVFYDNDEAGRKGTITLCDKHGLTHMYLNDIRGKDISDFVNVAGSYEGQKMMIRLIREAIGLTDLEVDYIVNKKVGIFQ